MQVHIDHYAEAQLQAKQAEKTKKLKHKRKNERIYASMKHTDLTIKAGTDDAALIYQTIDSNQTTPLDEDLMDATFKNI
jgi:hypothetical protein|tara:strand:+ start:1790 stop:2026 length:237 start_codon:yes stop_codon:yes gene_type:complete